MIYKKVWKVRKELKIWKSLFGPNLAGPFLFFSFFSISFSSRGPLQSPDQPTSGPTCPCRRRHPGPVVCHLPVAAHCPDVTPGLHAQVVWALDSVLKPCHARTPPKLGSYRTRILPFLWIQARNHRLRIKIDANQWKSPCAARRAQSLHKRCPGDPFSSMKT
jgi:hypothetical protein